MKRKHTRTQQQFDSLCSMLEAIIDAQYAEPYVHARYVQAYNNLVNSGFMDSVMRDKINSPYVMYITKVRAPELKRLSNYVRSIKPKG